MGIASRLDVRSRQDIYHLDQHHGLECTRGVNRGSTLRHGVPLELCKGAHLLCAGT